MLHLYTFYAKRFYKHRIVLSFATLIVSESKSFHFWKRQTSFLRIILRPKNSIFTTKPKDLSTLVKLSNTYQTFLQSGNLFTHVKFFFDKKTFHTFEPFPQGRNLSRHVDIFLDQGTFLCM